MWDGHLACIKITKHWIELTYSYVRPVVSPPYHTGSMARPYALKEIHKMLQEEITEHANTEWVGSIISAPKKYGLLKFFVAYCKLNAVTGRQSYPLPRMYAYIDFVEEGRVFWTLDANSVYWWVEIDIHDKSKWRSWAITNSCNSCNCLSVWKTHWRYSKERWKLYSVQ